jgi:hypothetical protein
MYPRTQCSTPVLYLILFITTIIILVRRKANGCKWNIGLTTLLFVGNTVYQVAMTMLVFGTLSVADDPTPSSVLSYLSMGVLSVCQ